MKIVFIGPSAPDARWLAEAEGLELRGPAGRGDIAAAALGGANIIGLVDGTFETGAAVWHKELLFALSQGVQVFGAASMGALRAAECQAFGMVGVGSIFASYAKSALIDDDAVAVIHAPVELNYQSLSEPLVNVEATIHVLDALGVLQNGEATAIMEAACGLFFKDRTYVQILDSVAGLANSRKSEIAKLIGKHRRDVKREDALELMRVVSATPDERVLPPGDWRFTETVAWNKLLDEVSRRGRAPDLQKQSA